MNYFRVSLEITQLVLLRTSFLCSPQKARPGLCYPWCWCSRPDRRRIHHERRVFVGFTETSYLSLANISAEFRRVYITLLLTLPADLITLEDWIVTARADFRAESTMEVLSSRLLMKGSLKHRDRFEWSPRWRGLSVKGEDGMLEGRMLHLGKYPVTFKYSFSTSLI